MLKLIRVPEIKKDNPFQDANDILSSFPKSTHESREPTEAEKQGRRNSGYHVDKKKPKRPMIKTNKPLKKAPTTNDKTQIKRP